MRPSLPRDGGKHMSSRIQAVGMGNGCRVQGLRGVKVSEACGLNLFGDVGCGICECLLRY